MRKPTGEALGPGERSAAIRRSVPEISRATYRQTDRQSKRINIIDEYYRSVMENAYILTAKISHLRCISVHDSIDTKEG